MSFPLLQERRYDNTLNGLNTCVNKGTLHLDLQSSTSTELNCQDKEIQYLTQRRAQPRSGSAIHITFPKRIQDTSIKASSSLMDLRTCGINGDDAPKQITVHRQSSFSRKASSLKRFSLFVNTDPTAYYNGQSAIEDYLASFSDYISSNSNWKLPNIPSSYKEIMDTNILSEDDVDQQVAIWELIQTEHCFLSQLAIIKNVFLYCLDSLKSADLLVTKGTNYYNIFGNINEIYLAHLCFWKKTLLPCLQKASLYHIPINLSELVRRFPNCKELFFVHEDYCLSHNINLQEVDKAMKTPEFKAYIKWCEARPECQRLHLKDFLAKPMQRVTKYPLLLKAILKKTHNNDTREQLIGIIEDMEQLVQAINLAVHRHEEIEKVKEISQKITSYNMGDFPRGWEEFLQPYMQLDLMAPMAGVDPMHHRRLLLDGTLRYKDSINKVDTCVFLFTDVLVITKPIKKGNEQLAIYKPPLRVDQLLIKEGSNPACFSVIYMSELWIPILWFNLRAASSHTASVWMKKIHYAQKQYVLLTNRNSVSVSDTDAPRCSNGSDTSLSTFGDEDVCSSPGTPQTDSFPNTPQMDSIPLVQISNCDEDDDYENGRHHQHKPCQNFVLTPSCSSSSLTNSSSFVVHIATQTDS